MIGSIVAGKYRIVNEIGRGAMGVVYLAESLNDHEQKLAIKVLSRALSRNPNFRKRFFNEAQRQGRLDHPNIVRVRDFVEESGQLFIAFDHVDGQSLDQFIKDRKGGIVASEALPMFKAVLEALDFGHRRGVIHRDVKPSNILIDRSGRVLLTDFGVALKVGDQRLTQAGISVGSPSYMSPEQILRPQSLDHRTDVYSAGIVLFEMLTGSAPFEGKTDFDIMQNQVKLSPPYPRHRGTKIDERLARIVLRALQKDPDRRFQGCAEFAKAIDAYSTAERQPRKRWPMALAVIAGVLAAIAWMVSHV
jgi:serine/threonine protein kinase